MSYRESGKKCLSLVIKQEKNVDIYEKCIYQISGCEKDYKNLVYQTFSKLKNGGNLKETLISIKEGNIDWDDPVFKEYKDKIQEQDEFLTNPFSVEEGVLVCNKCGSNKTFSYTKQVRRADEGTTVFCICVKCNARWKIN